MPTAFSTLLGSRLAFSGRPVWTVGKIDGALRFGAVSDYVATSGPVVNTSQSGVKEALDREDVCYEFTRKLIEQHPDLGGIYHFGAAMSGIVHAIKDAGWSDPVSGCGT